ncbi:ribulose-phosphate 3-epimerase [Clostridium beijerinckii]|uniref:ribulose-phosphate 3-epimerase n=1 Tax=Clostridium beijerinckii TaxID=1520 RepID=UPI00156FBB14|nr:ribulose-phosphate 3-epimerase [Clostridium beijerinckii]NRY60110.1 ribulose-phosphate 3-epimerase [Clostridium beijerinckii]
MIKLAPSILAADFANLGAEIEKIDKAGAEYVHIDVMDGLFVPSLSLGFPVIKSIRKYSNRVFDVHLMVENPDRYIDETAQAGADIITVHVEACKHIHRTIQKIKEAGKKAGVVLNPGTPLETLEYILEDVDMVLLMTVNPGFGGQKYIETMTTKITNLRKMIEERKLTVNIEVDGGIKLDNLSKVIEAGANIIVAGSSIFNEDTVSNICNFKKIMDQHN